jgi:UPF0755 protein
MKRNCIATLILTPIIILACIILAILAGLPAWVADYTETIYGPASESLDLQDQIYLTAYLLYHQNDLTHSQNSDGEDTVFQVELGESPISVSQRLYQAGLIPNPEAFKHFLLYSGLDTKIQAGDYRLNPRYTPVEIARQLQDPTPHAIEFGILAGWRAEEIAAALPTSGLSISPQDFLDNVDQKGLEGHLYPGLYTFERDITTNQMINALTTAFDSALNAELEAGFEKLGFSLQETVILASIVEREAVVEDEMPLIASVFINRLNAGMKLDADPTVQYALGFNTTQGNWWTNPLSAQDLTIDSAYNTYLYPGLPPGPICNPGLNALRAVAFPASTPYYYFRAACDGSGRHSFAETFEEHIQNECP